MTILTPPPSTAPHPKNVAQTSLGQSRRWTRFKQTPLNVLHILRRKYFGSNEKVGFVVCTLSCSAAAAALRIFMSTHEERASRYTCYVWNSLQQHAKQFSSYKHQAIECILSICMNHTRVSDQVKKDLVRSCPIRKGLLAHERVSFTSPVATMLKVFRLFQPRLSRWTCSESLRDRWDGVQQNVYIAHVLHLATMFGSSLAECD